MACGQQCYLYLQSLKYLASLKAEQMLDYTHCRACKKFEKKLTCSHGFYSNRKILAMNCVVFHCIFPGVCHRL